MNIYWFRRDLRLEDNKALFESLQNGEGVLPIFIFDSFILDQLPKDDARVSFIHDLLENINTGLQKKGKSLAVFLENQSQLLKS
jgi:deoxyribodipyrimidine photo-lyase